MQRSTLGHSLKKYKPQFLQDHATDILTRGECHVSIGFIDLVSLLVGKLTEGKFGWI